MGGLNARAQWESCGIGNRPRCSLWVSKAPLVLFLKLFRFTLES